MELEQLPKKYRLRWRFDYKDAVASKYGVWDYSGKENELEAKAWCKNKNVKYAIIEGKDLESKEIIVLAECLGEDFINFEWIAAMPFKGFMQILGLQIRTREHVLKVYTTGETELVSRPKNDDKIHLATFGK